MSLDLVPKSLRKKYGIDERNHACAILAADFPNEFRDIVDCLTAFSLRKSDVLAPGGRRSTISEAIDGFLSGWKPKKLSKCSSTAPKSIGRPGGAARQRLREGRVSPSQAPRNSKASRGCGLLRNFSSVRSMPARCKHSSLTRGTKVWLSQAMRVPRKGRSQASRGSIGSPK